jgi:hypothetical protein
MVCHWYDMSTLKCGPERTLGPDHGPAHRLGQPEAAARRSPTLVLMRGPPDRVRRLHGDDPSFVKRHAGIGRRGVDPHAQVSGRARSPMDAEGVGRVVAVAVRERRGDAHLHALPTVRHRVSRSAGVRAAIIPQGLAHLLDRQPVAVLDALDHERGQRHLVRAEQRVAPACLLIEQGVRADRSSR